MKKIFIPFLFCVLLMLSACGGGDKIHAPFEDSYCRGKDLDSIVNQLQDSGFTNIEMVPQGTATSFNANQVISVKIGSNTTYNTANAWGPDVKIVVKYYEFTGEDTPEPTPSSEPAPELSQNVELTDTPDPTSSSALSLGDIDLALRTSLYAGFGENYTLSTDGLTYTATVWGDGVAMNATLASLGNTENLEVWNNLVDSTLSAAENLQSILSDNGHSDMVFIMQIANDMNENHDTVLLSVSLGTVLYDYVNGIDLIG